MNESVRKLVENALGIDKHLENWNDLECELCNTSAVMQVTFGALSAALNTFASGASPQGG